MAAPPPPPASPPPPNRKFCQYYQKTPEKQKLNSSNSAPSHTKTRVSPKYPANDCRSKIAQCLFHAPFAALIMCKEIDSAPVNKTKLMAYSVRHSGQSAIKDACLIKICTHLACSLALTKYTLSFFKHLKETMAPGVKWTLSSSFIQKGKNCRE